MLRVAFFYLLLLAVVWLAFRRGDRETRAAGLVALTATLLSAASVRLLGGGQPVEAAVAMVDLAVLALFVAIALRSNRFWPLWVAGLQLTTVLAHLLRMLSPDLVYFAYQAAMRFWSYPILFIIAAAALRTRRYEVEARPA
ncbi:hypothetical protein [Sphingomonas arenae]|uniref:hypothetical protein n=1 Tax=Sphingomonas arenae TaxID=2812555 RepID=UPI001967E8A0|nr:hypothetical protein [Sphingomonas arenae]